MYHSMHLINGQPKMIFVDICDLTPQRWKNQDLDRVNMIPKRFLFHIVQLMHVNIEKYVGVDDSLIDSEKIQMKINCNTLWFY